MGDEAPSRSTIPPPSADPQKSSGASTDASTPSTGPSTGSSSAAPSTGATSVVASPDPEKKRPRAKRRTSKHKQTTNTPSITPTTPDPAASSSTASRSQILDALGRAPPVPRRILTVPHGPANTPPPGTFRSASLPHASATALVRTPPERNIALAEVDTFGAGQMIATTNRGQAIPWRRSSRASVGRGRGSSDGGSGSSGDVPTLTSLGLSGSVGTGKELSSNAVLKTSITRGQSSTSASQSTSKGKGKDTGGGTA